MVRIHKHSKPFNSEEYDMVTKAMAKEEKLKAYENELGNLTEEIWRLEQELLEARNLFNEIREAIKKSKGE
jgi:predicted  nucleic acid-binding Zn-ribbon protein